MKIESQYVVQGQDVTHEICASDPLPSSHYLAPLYQNSNKLQPPFTIHNIQRSGEESLAVISYPKSSKPLNLTIGEFDQDGVLVSQLPFEPYRKTRRHLLFCRKGASATEAETLPVDLGLHTPSGFGSIDVQGATTSNSHIVLYGVLRMPTAQHGETEIICVNGNGQHINRRATFLSPLKGIPETYANGFFDRAFAIQIPFNQGTVHVLAWDKQAPGFSACSAVTADRIERMTSGSDAAFAGRQGIFAAANTIQQNNKPLRFYNQWIAESRPSAEQLENQRRVVFSTSPKFSLVVPLYQTPKQLFIEMVDSVLNQSYEHWELILVNASPELARLQEDIVDVRNKDERIVCVELNENKGISLNTNAGIKQATGDYICFLDHDDTLEPDALFEYAQAIERNPTIDVLYCDEDHQTPEGYYTNPLIKPDPNLDFLCNNNYVCHMLAVARPLLLSFNPNTQENDGAQDHNTTIQAFEKAQCIHHVRKVLYHWRMSEHSVSSSPDNKSYANEAGIRAVQDHFDRHGICASVSRGRRPFTYLVNYAWEQDEDSVTAVVFSNGEKDRLKTNLDLLHKRLGRALREVYLIEKEGRLAGDKNCISEASLSYDIKLISLYDHPTRSAALNAALYAAQGSYLFLLDGFTAIEESFDPEPLFGPLSRPEVAAAGCRIFNPDDTLYHAGYFLHSNGSIRSYSQGMPRGRWGAFDFPDAQREVSAVSSQCLAMRAKTFKQLQGFDDRYRQSFYDVDFCLRARKAGYKIYYTPETEVRHQARLESLPPLERMQQRAAQHADEALLLSEWASLFAQGDPYMRPQAPYLPTWMF